MLAGRTFVGPVARLAGAPVALGAEVKDLPPLGPREERLDRAARFALAAAARALEDAGIAGGSDPDRRGVVVGSSRGPEELFEAAHRRFVERGPEAVGPHASPHTTPGNLSGAVARSLGLRGPSLTVSAACSSGSQAIGLAFDWVRGGRADLVVAGGTEACLTPFAMSMFAAARILSPGACRPFDRDRDGIVVGEGAGMVVIESEESARARGARAYCELLGFGATCDAYSLAGLPPDGEGLARAIRMALEDASLGPEAVAAVNAHGTGTVAGDRAETAALRSALGAHAGKVPVSATKSMTGHLVGAAGGIEAIACALAVAEGAVPPTINLRNPDPECDLDYVSGGARRRPVPVALSSSMGFGGNNAVLVFGAVGDGARVL
jgi:3-oxoacyl-[acyl-carrier-protein] synthase II